MPGYGVNRGHMKYLLFFFLLFTITFSRPNAHAAEPGSVGWFDMVLYYLAKEPSIKSTKMPVLILLHGIGSNEKDLFHLADKLHPQMLIISVRAPIQLDKGAYA
jgi:hypothetical protein